jgi:hypothetical protein
MSNCLGPHVGTVEIILALAFVVEITAATTDKVIANPVQNRASSTTGEDRTAKPRPFAPTVAGSPVEEEGLQDVPPGGPAITHAVIELDAVDCHMDGD